MLPEKFITRLLQIVPSALAPTIFQTFHAEKHTFFRVNNLHANVGAVLKELHDDNINVHSVDGYKLAFWVPAEYRQGLMQTHAYLEHKIYIQRLESMLVPLVLDPKPGEEILDLTSAPGSKTTQMSCLMNNEGRIAAVEKVKSRFFKLQRNCQAQGATCVQTYLKDGVRVGKVCPDRFDRVLLDAPCSSEGRFVADDAETYRYWSPAKIKAMAAKQWRLLQSAYLAVKPGGTIVYSTCTFAPEENEAVVAKLLKKYPDTVEVLPIEIPIDTISPGLTSWNERTFPESLTQAVRVLPTDQVNGFFICRLRRRNCNLP